EEAVTRSGSFFAEPESDKFSASGGSFLRFRSPIQTETASCNFAYVRIEHTMRRRRAVLIVPHWNVSGEGYSSLSRLLRFGGFGTAEITLPYHGRRIAEGSHVADGFLSANIGQTIRSVRQSVLECRQILGYLQHCGYEELNIVGVSLGSCIAGLVAAHDN